MDGKSALILNRTRRKLGWKNQGLLMDIETKIKLLGNRDMKQASKTT